MPYLIAFVALVGVLCLLDLVLTFGVIRRLREQTKLIDALYEFVGVTRALPGQDNGPAAGDVVDDFAATTVDGVPVSRDLLSNGTVVAFLSPDCRGCRDALPEVVSWAKEQPVLAVVDGRTGDPAQLVEALTPVAQVVVDGGPIGSAFRLKSVPFYCVIGEGGRLAAVSPRISRLPVGAPG